MSIKKKKQIIIKLQENKHNFKIILRLICYIILAYMLSRHDDLFFDIQIWYNEWIEQNIYVNKSFSFFFSFFIKWFPEFMQSIYCCGFRDIYKASNRKIILNACNYVSPHSISPCLPSYLTKIAGERIFGFMSTPKAWREPNGLGRNFQSIRWFVFPIVYLL